MIALEIARLAVTFANAVAAVVAAVGIWYGIRAMVRANDERGQQQRAATQQQSAAMLQQSEAEERRHKAMLQTMQDQREAEERRHEEAMEQQRAAMQQQREAEERRHKADESRHEESMTALKALIRRTAAPETVAERTTPTDDGAGTKGA